MPYNTFSVWMPLQEATLENGCMVFMPGSHKEEFAAHQSIGGDTCVHGLEMLDTADEVRTVACPLPAGGAALHRSRTMHFVSANRPAVLRLAYILGFGPLPIAREDDRRFLWLEVRQTVRESEKSAA